MTIIGTSHFTSAHAARRYYADYGLTARDVARKLSDGEIAIGPPAAKPGERVRVIATEGRYQVITTDNAPGGTP